METILEIITTITFLLLIFLILRRIANGKISARPQYTLLFTKGRKNLWGMALFVGVCLAVAFLITFPGKKADKKIAIGSDWDIVKQEGFPCIVVDEKGNIVGTKRGDLLTKIYLDYAASGKNNGFVPYRIESGAFSACSQLKTLIIPEQSKVVSYITYIAEDAFQGCSEELVVYCQKGSYVWNRLQELKITTKEYKNQEEWCQLGGDTAKLKEIQTRLETEGNEAVTTEEILSLYGEPFFIITENGELSHMICGSLENYPYEKRFPKEAVVLDGTFAQYYMEKEEVTIPKQIKEIGDATFLHCSIPKITFEEGSQLERIGKNAIMDERISEIQLPDGLKEIDSHGFAWCMNLQEITIPASVEKIGECCFNLCSSLEKVIILNPEVKLEGENIFDATIFDENSKEQPNEKLTIYCHKGSNAEKYAKKYGLQVQYID